MRTFIQPAEVVTYLVTAATTPVPQGGVVIDDTLVGVANVPITTANGGVSAVTGEECEVKRHGIYELAKTAGIAFVAGEELYWDAALLSLTNVATGNALIGTAVEITAAAAVLAEVRLLGDASSVAAAGVMGVGANGGKWVPAIAGMSAISGAWTDTAGVNARRMLRRTAAAADEVLRIHIPMDTDERAGRGKRITSYECIYAVNTADADDVRFELYSGNLPADNAGAAAGVMLAGGLALQALEYDAAHDTAAERGDDTAAPEYHTAVVTPSVDTVFMSADGVAEVWIDVFADCAGAAASVVDVYGVYVYFEEL